MGATPSTAVLSKNMTLPVAPPLTVAVSVRACPKMTGFGEALKEVLLGRTMWVASMAEFVPDVLVTDAVLVIVDTPNPFPTFTVTVISGKLVAVDSGSERVQVTVLSTQAHPVPPRAVAVRPAGRESVTVTVPVFVAKLKLPTVMP